ncbi:MAG: RpiB/LacA/LacB family sugar-phosphate isomerase [Acidobacteria bacterium]|nr:RpiB/LacA/LacB family sugar-phosphate isomerase [Acidobacteriota bacterium]MBK8147833.1 RpiB/LacA/LacB family sugar-phosphate isomerase [Acidobacteriota bacterium]
MADNNETRDRVRELVRQVLSAVPSEEKPKVNSIEHVVVNSLQNKVGREFDRDESARSLITEDDLRGLEPGSKLRIAANAKFTPLADDLVRERGIVLIKKESRRATTKVRSVAVGCDHGGFEYKEKLLVFLTELGLNVRDFGTDSKEAVDYPDFAHAVAFAVSRRQTDVGIIIDGAGIGSAMTANKVPNVRAAACYSPALARNSREHNGANVLTLGSGQNTVDEIRDIVMAFLTSDISEERHLKRVGKIDAVEREYKK